MHTFLHSFSTGFYQKAALIVLLYFIQTTHVFSATFTSNANGNWTATGTWSVSGTDADGIPDADDAVIIGNHDVTLQSNAACNTLQMDWSAYLNMNAYNLAVTGNLIRNGDSWDIVGTGGGSNTLSIGGDATLTYACHINTTGYNISIGGNLRIENQGYINIAAANLSLNGNYSTDGQGAYITWTSGTVTTGGTVTYAHSWGTPLFNCTGTGYWQHNGSTINLNSALSVPRFRVGNASMTINTNTLTVSSVYDRNCIAAPTGTVSAASTINASCGSITLASNVVGALSVCAGRIKSALQSFTITPSGGAGNLTNIAFTTTGTYTQSDILSYQLWFSATNDLNTATQVGVDLSSSGGAGLRTFSAFSSPSMSAGTTYYFWITASIASVAVNNNTIAVNEIATADLTSSSTKSGGPATAGGTQTLKAKPIVSASSSATGICSGASVNVSASGASTYVWSTAQSGTPVSVSPATNTTYTVTGTDILGCANTATVAVSVYAANAGSDVESCAAVTLTATGGGTYLWSNGDAVAVINVNPASTTTYTVTVTNSGVACTDQMVLTVSNPIVTIASPSQVTVSNVDQGKMKHALSAFTIAASSGASVVSQVNFTTAGTYIAADVSRFQLWYNTSNDLASAMQLGSSITTGLGAGAKSFSGFTQSVSSGATANFWITADIASAANVANTISVNAIANSGITVCGTKSGSVTAGAAQTIIASGPTYYSIASASWDNASTWSTAGCGGVAGSVVPNAATDNVVICNGTTVTLNNTVQCNNLTINSGGTLQAQWNNFTINGTTSVSGTFQDNNGGTNVFAGAVTINAGGVWNVTANGADQEFRNGLSFYGTTFNAGDAWYKFTTNNQSINGNAQIAITGGAGKGMQINGVSLTNNLSVGNGLYLFNNNPKMEGSGTFVNKGLLTWASGTSDAPSVTNFDVSSFSNTVVYARGGDQHVRTGNYYNLTIAGGSGKKTLQGTTAVSNTLIINSGATLEVTDKNLTVGGNTSISGILQDNSNTGTTSLQAVDLSGGSIQDDNGTHDGVVNINGELTLSSGNGSIGRVVLTVGDSTKISSGRTLTLNNTNGIKSFAGIKNEGTFTSTSLTNTANLLFGALGICNTGTFNAGGATFASSQNLTGTNALNFANNVIVNASRSVINHLAVNITQTFTNNGTFVNDCGAVVSTSSSFVNNGAIRGPLSGGEFGRFVNAVSVTNNGNIATDNSYLSFSGNISGGTVGANVFKNTTQAASCSAGPVIVVESAGISSFSYCLGMGPSAAQFYNVTGIGLSGNLVITALADYQLSKDNVSWATTLTYIPSGGSVSTSRVYVRLKSALAVGTYNAETIQHASTGATTKNVIVNGEVSNTTPTAAAGADVTNCGKVSTSLTASGGNTYVWSTEEITASISVAPLITTTYTVTVMNTGGCTASDQVVVIVKSAGLTQSVSLGAAYTLQASGGTTYVWSNGGANPQTLTAPGSSQVITYTVTIDGACVQEVMVVVDNQTCTSTPIAEAIANGSFESGNTGFTTSLSLKPSSNQFSTAGEYVIGTDEQNLCNGCGMTDTKDHTSGAGYAMYIDGPNTANTTLWQQTINVNQNQTYYFSAWVSIIYPDQPALLQFYVNGSPLGASFDFTGKTLGRWYQIFNLWASGSNTTATITLQSQRAFGSITGNDFALDDISFINGCQNISGMGNPNLGPTQNICSSGGTITLDAGINSVGSYSWYQGAGTPQSALVKSDGSTVTNPTANNTSVTISAAGTYRVCFDDGITCPASSTVVISKSMTATIDDATLCVPTTAVLSPTVTPSNAAYAYLWNTTETDSYITVTAGGTYTVTVSNAAVSGCSASDNAFVNSHLPAVPASLTYSSDDATITLTLGDGVSYNWYTDSDANNLIGTGASVNYTLPADQYGNLTVYIKKESSPVCDPVPVVYADLIMLPITLLYVKGECTEQGKRIVWATASETNNDYFTVERSIDGVNYELLGKVKGAGSSIYLKEYELTDVASSDRYMYYRLTQTDYDGAYVIMDPIEVACNHSKQDASVVSYVSSGNRMNLYLVFEGLQDEKVKIALYDKIGQLIAIEDKYIVGSEPVMIQLGHPLAQGVYFLRAITTEVQLVQKLFLH